MKKLMKSENLYKISVKAVFPLIRPKMFLIYAESQSKAPPSVATVRYEMTEV